MPGNGPPEIFIPSSVFDLLQNCSLDEGGELLSPEDVPIDLVVVAGNKKFKPEWATFDAAPASVPEVSIDATTLDLLQDGDWEDGRVESSGETYSLVLEQHDDGSLHMSATEASGGGGGLSVQTGGAAALLLLGAVGISLWTRRRSLLRA